MLSWDLWNAWKMRAFLLAGLLIIATDLLGEGMIDPAVPTWLNIYLLVASSYFIINIQNRVATRWQERLVRLLFPGAFVTTLLPIYALALFLARSGWF